MALIQKDCLSKWIPVLNKMGGGWQAKIDLLLYVTGLAKRDLFDRFFKIEFSSHSSATGIALNGDLIRAYHTVKLSRKIGLIMQ